MNKLKKTTSLYMGLYVAGFSYLICAFNASSVEVMLLVILILALKVGESQESMTVQVYSERSADE